jgi:hypothetical protein
MAENTKASDEGKPQKPAEQSKPQPSKQEDFSVRRVMVGDSAEMLRKNNK